MAAGLEEWTNELAYWIKLERTSGVGPETAPKLLARFGLPENIFSENLSSLTQIVPERVAHALLVPMSDETKTLIDKTITWADQPGNHVLTLADTGYPKTL